MVGQEMGDAVDLFLCSLQDWCRGDSRPLDSRYHSGFGAHGYVEAWYDMAGGGLTNGITYGGMFILCK